MKKKILVLSLLGLSFPLLSACNSNNSETVLRVLNMEDYIYLYEPESEDSTPEDQRFDLVEQFENYINNDEELHAKYGNVRVVYSCTDTNETLYSELQTGKAVYDLICPSDYMIQKLIIGGYLENVNRDLIPNYDDYGSSYIIDRFDNITSFTYNKETQSQETAFLKDYAVGYMWGTLGILYNPEFAGFSEYAKENIHEDVKSWSILWDENYKGTISVKDSMRDTYAAGIIKAYEEELALKREELSPEDYRVYLENVFNRFDQDSVDLVKNALTELKANVFGLEVDSGKEDINKGMIGMNLAWSGDAVYAMEQAAEYGNTLYYSIPLEGSNVWFDGWCIPKRPSSNPRSNLEYELAHEFLNFLCDPVNAVQNVDYIGYTSFIVGDDMRDLVRDYYDVRYEYMYVPEVFNEEATGDEFPVYYVTEEYDEELEENVEVINYLSYEDFGALHNDEYNDLPLYYDGYVTKEENGEEVYVYVDEEASEDELEILMDRFPFVDPYGEDELTYASLTNDYIAQIEDISEIELEYIFGGDKENYTFYTFSYFDGAGDDNNWTGLDFFCQFPDAETTGRCAVMKYDHQNNERLVKMWEDFKSDALPLWAIILLAVELTFGGAFVLQKVLGKAIKKHHRIKRLNKAK